MNSNLYVNYNWLTISLFKKKKNVTNNALRMFVPVLIECSPKAVRSNNFVHLTWLTIKDHIAPLLLLSSFKLFLFNFKFAPYEVLQATLYTKILVYLTCVISTVRWYSTAPASRKRFTITVQRNF